MSEMDNKQGMSLTCPAIRTSPALAHLSRSSLVTEPGLAGSLAPARTKNVSARPALTVRAASTYSETPLSYRSREAIVTTSAFVAIPMDALISSWSLRLTESGLNVCEIDG